MREQITLKSGLGGGSDKETNYLIGCIYRPSVFTDLDDVRMVLSNAKDYVDKNGFDDLLIMGDFNFANIKWLSGFVEEINAGENSIENRFKDIVNDLFMIQHVMQPTFQLSNSVLNNTLDLIFTTQQESGAE